MAYSKWLKKPGGQRLCILYQPKKKSNALDLGFILWNNWDFIRPEGNTAEIQRNVSHVLWNPEFSCKNSRGKILHLLCLVRIEDWLWYKLYMMAGWWWCSGLDFLVLWGLTNGNGVTSPSVDFQTYLKLASRRPPKFKPNPRTELGLQYQRQIWSQAAYEKGGMIAARINIRN